MKQREIWKRIGIGLLSATLLLGNVQCVWASENPESLNTSAYSEYNISLSTSKTTSTGKLKAAKSLKKSAKVTVVGTATVKKVKYYAIKSGKSTLLVKQSLLSKTKPKTAKPSSKPSTNSSKHPTPQNNTPSGYKEPTNHTPKVTNGVPEVTPITKVKVVNGKIEYRDIDGKIKYGKYKFIYGTYSYWYTMKDGRGFWMPIDNTDLTTGYWDEGDMVDFYYGQQMVDSYYD